MDEAVQDMQRAYILELYHEPLHAGTIEHATGHGVAHNQSCGDMVEIDVVIANGILQNARHAGHGCAISKAATSLMLDEYIGKSLKEIEQISKETIQTLLGIPISHTRDKCATIGMHALFNAIHKDI